MDRENSIQILYCDFCEFDALELPWDRRGGSEVVCAMFDILENGSKQHWLFRESLDGFLNVLCKV